METTKKRYAFISYNHKDAKWAKWLQEKLESYKLPADIHNEFENSRYLRPVFRDKTDLNTGVLANELRKELEESKYLVVICSPNSAKSAWVSDEVKAFIEMDRLDYIIPFIVSGTPHNYKERDCESPYEDECFPFFLRQYTKQHPELELLGISTDEVGKEKAFIRVVSRMLGVSFDVLWKRHERDKRNRRIVSVLCTCILLVLTYWFAAPISVKINLKDSEHQLPLPQEVLISFNHSLYKTKSIDTTVVVSKIPGYLRLSKVLLTIKATYYQNVVEEIKIPMGISKNLEIQMLRDETFELFAGHVYDEDGNPIERANVTIENIVAQTDKNGFFSISFPVQKQSVTKAIKMSKEGYRSIVRYDETPNNDLKYILER